MTLLLLIFLLAFVLDVQGIEVRGFGPNAFIAETVQGNFAVPNKDSTIADFLKRCGQWEYNSIKLVREILARQRTLIQSAGEDGDESYDYIIFDIGANLGTWSIPLSFLPHAKVYAFEPQRYMVQYLRASVLLNGVRNVLPVYSAVSNETGHITINDIPANPHAAITNGLINYGGLSLLSDLTNPSFRVHFGQSAVPTITLDAFRQHTLRGACPRFLKLDIEMYEVYAFIGARQLLRECRPVVFMESHCTALNKPMFLLLHSMGYQLYWVVHPLLDTEILARYNATINYEAIKDWSDFYFNMMIFGSLNLLALPKQYTSPVTGKTVSAHSIAEPFLNQSLYPVRIGNGRMDSDVADANIHYCLDGLRCGRYYFIHEHGNPNKDRDYVDGDCGPDHTLNSFLTEYWKHYTFAMK
eukprot:gene34652-41964_t